MQAGLGRPRRCADIQDRQIPAHKMRQMREEISCNGSDDNLEKGPGARLESGGGAARVRSKLWLTQLVAQSPRAPKVHVIEAITEPDIDRREELEGRFSLALMQRSCRAVGRDDELKGTGALAFCKHCR